MAGFNLPVAAIPPDLLAKMAAAAFHPPALMGGGGGGGGGMGALPQSPGFNMGQAMAGAGQGLGMLAGEFGKGKPPTVEELNDILRQRGTYGGPSPTVTADIPINPSLSYGGPRADGGPVVPGKYYTVGEQGPETFVPAVPGRIYPDTNASPRRERFYPDTNTRDFFGGRARR